MSEKSFSGVFGWPTVIVQYLVAPFIIFLGFLIRFRNPMLRTCVLSAASFFLGMAGYALALSSIFTLIVLQISDRSRIDLRRFILIEVSIFLGFLLSFFSPGSRTRAEVLLSGDPLILHTSFSRWVFVSSIEFLASVFSVGNLIVFSIISLVFYSLGQKLIYFVDLARLRHFSHKALIFSFIYYVSISFSEYFTYEAFWHLITYRSVVFIICTLLGVELAIWLLNHEFKGKYPQRRFLAIFFTAVIFCLSLLSSWQENASLINRGKIWALSAAPLPGIGDIDPKGNWIESCWLNLQHARQLPDRH